MKRTKSYQENLLENLQDHREAAAYLNAALTEGDADVFLLALRNVAEALGGMAKLARWTGLNRESLYRMMSKKGNPGLTSLNLLLEALGLRLAVEIQSPRLPRRLTKAHAT